MPAGTHPTPSRPAHLLLVPAVVRRQVASFAGAPLLCIHVASWAAVERVAEVVLLRGVAVLPTHCKVQQSARLALSMLDGGRVSVEAERALHVALVILRHFYGVTA